MKRKVLIVCSAILLTLVTANSYSQDWPQFRGTNRDSKVTGFKAPATWPADLSQAWKIQVGTGDATPALSGNRMYLNTRQGDNEVILCIDASTGKEIWRNQYPSAAVTGPAASHPGPRSTPAVTNGKVITFGAAGILSCCDAATGKLLWRRDNKENLYPQFYTGMSPLIADNLCIVHIGGKDKGQVIAIDIETGKDKWTNNGDSPSYASPSIMTNAGKKLVVVQSEKFLTGHDLSDGKVLWQVATAPAQRFYNSVSPYINGNIVYISGQGTGTKAIKPGNTPEEIWSNTEAGAKWTTPVLKDGYLYGFTDQKRIYCINAETGKTAWIDNAVTSDFATISDCGNVLVGMPSTGTLLIFKPDPKGYSEVARYKVAETPVYSFPVIAGNNIYIKDAESLTMFSIK
ncbi:MAG TPA: PQQ-binding-like beta-propeller repeat protein [Bacteroidales bacterium]|nr:PQQ-binding-like beta-propeller repeat protein [Bacteroidales bacterium]